LKAILSILLLFISAAFLWPGPLSAHGVQGQVAPGGLVVSAAYSDGEPMSYALVKVFAPEAELTFQTGRTDRNGRFCFFPDRAGSWRMLVDDEMGHLLAMEMPVTETLHLERPEHAVSGTGITSRFQGILVGISIIFGIFGIVCWLKSRGKSAGLN